MRAFLVALGPNTSLTSLNVGRNGLTQSESLCRFLEDHPNIVNLNIDGTIIRLNLDIDDGNRLVSQGTTVMIRQSEIWPNYLPPIQIVGPS